jgi:tight adherence protein C
MIWLIWATVFATFFLATYGVVIAWNRRQRAQVRLSHSGTMMESPLFRQKEQTSRFRGWLIQWLSYSGEWALGDLAKVTELRKDLIKAGYRDPQAPAIYLGVRVIAAFACTLPFLLFIIMKGALNPFSLAAAFVPALFGFFLVSKILAVKIRTRQERLDKSLPDIIDLFVISMEAGLSINASLQRVAEEIRDVYQDFSDELQIAVGELRAGIPWDEAFDNLGKRTDVPSIRSMVGLMIQSNKLGTSIGDALRNHSDFIRTQRILLAEERAAKLPVKMIFPLIFCIMPAIMIVVAGPGIIHMIEIFFKAGPGGIFQVTR